MHIRANPKNEAARIAMDIYTHTLEAVPGDKLVAPYLPSMENELREARRIFVCGAGKASVAMARGCLDFLGDRCSGGLVITKDGYGEDLGPIEVLESSHPIPDQRSLDAGERMLEFAHKCDHRDTVLFCLSGGASALMEALPDNCTLDWLQTETEKLLASGKDIGEINRWRKEHSRIKAGGLHLAFKKTPIICFVLNDVMNQGIDVVGSGPFSLPHQKPQYPFVVDMIQDVVRSGFARKLISVGDHRTAQKAAINHSHKLAIRTLPGALEGDAREWIVTIVNDVAPTQCYIATGEPTVTVQGTGRGGRCQHMALAAAIEIAGQENIAVLCGSTDGTDGPTDFAGALVDGHTLQGTNLDAEAYLANNDSQTYLAAADALIHTGPTGSNVNDIVIVIRK